MDLQGTSRQQHCPEATTGNSGVLGTRLSQRAQTSPVAQAGPRALEMRKTRIPRETQQEQQRNNGDARDGVGCGLGDDLEDDNLNGEKENGDAFASIHTSHSEVGFGSMDVAVVISSAHPSTISSLAPGGFLGARVRTVVDRYSVCCSALADCPLAVLICLLTHSRISASI